MDWRVEKHFLKKFRSIFQYICQNQLSETAISAGGPRVTSKSVMFCTRPESQCWTFGSTPNSQIKLFYGQWFIISKPDIGILFALIWQRVWQNNDNFLMVIEFESRARNHIALEGCSNWKMKTEIATWREKNTILWQNGNRVTPKRRTQKIKTEIAVWIVSSQNGFFSA